MPSYKKPSEIDRIMALHPDLGSTIQPQHLTVSLGRGPEQLYGNMYTDWYVREGTILYTPVWGFGDKLDKAFAFSPDKVTDGKYVFRKVSDVPREPVTGVLIRDVEYELVSQGL